MLKKLKNINLMKNSNYKLMCLAGLISSIGDFMYSLACTWTIYNISGSVIGVAGMWLIRAIMRIPGQFISGIIVDKYNKRKICINIYLLNAVVTILFIFLSRKNIIIAYLLIFILQGTSDLDNIAQTSMLPQIVDKSNLQEANSIFQIIDTITMLVAPGLGGILYMKFGSNILYITDSITFVLAAIIFTFINYKGSCLASDHNKQSIIDLAKEGIIVTKKSNTAIMVIIIMLSCGVMGRFYEIYKVYFSDKLLNVGMNGLVYFSYAMSIGSLLTLLFIKHFNIVNKVKSLFFINIGLNLSYILWANSKIITLACLMNILIGFFETYTSILTNTIIQKTIDTKYLGRVFSLIKIATVLSAIVGIIIAPILLNLIGAANVVTIFGISLIIMNLIMLLSSKKNKL